MSIRGERKTRKHSHLERAREIRRYSLALLIVMFLATWVAGCGSTRPVKYYQLSYPTSAPAGPQAFNTALLVRMYTTSHLYREDSIVYGWDTGEMGIYEYQRWSEPPVELLQEAIVRGLRSSGRFRSVMTWKSTSRGDFNLTGQLYEFKEVDGSAIVARLNYEVQLRDLKTGTTVWKHSYNHDEPVAEKNIVAVVTAMDRNVQRSVQEVQAGIDEYFNSHRPQ
jgi:ABC-type uncharacterized transport system auxiliary subunit